MVTPHYPYCESLCLAIETLMSSRWRSPKLSAWYSVGLLARGRPEDIDLAIKYIAASLPEQYTIEGELPYGT